MDESMGDRRKRERIESLLCEGLSRAEVARRVGVDRKTVRNYRNAAAAGERTA